MANMDISQPPPETDRVVPAQVATDKAESKPCGQVIRLDDVRRRRVASGRRAWRPKGW
ncbi:MAG TPA: hypothetical protein VFE13_13610 [Caulobacteraceae bacterium]|jgi:hypothetical protein|nr:hypothetical protein [Caulobacteraceae bacterium]